MIKALKGAILILCSMREDKIPLIQIQQSKVLITNRMVNSSGLITIRLFNTSMKKRLKASNKTTTTNLSTINHN